MTAALRLRYSLAFALLSIPAVAPSQPAGPTVPITEFPIGISNFAGLRGITAGPDGAMWFVVPGGGPFGNSPYAIGRIAPNGAVTFFPLPPGPDPPMDITLGPDGALWYVRSAGFIGRITTSGVVTEFQIPGSFSLDSITSGPDGALWFTVPVAGLTGATPGSIGRITTAGATTFTTVSGPPHGITTGPDGALWFTESSFSENPTTRIGRITTAAALTEFIIPTDFSEPRGIARGPDGALWFTESSAGRIGRITTAGAFTEFPLSNVESGPLGIAAGPDGALWFTENDANTIGRITPAGIIDEYAVPTSDSGPYGIATGPDGGIWFTENLTSIVGRVGLGITTQFLPPGATRQPYSFTMQAQAGTIPYTWSASGLPPGLTISTSGVISGTPTTAGTFSPVISVRDSSNPQQSAQFTYSLSISQSLTVTASCPAATALQGSPYSFTITATGGNSPYTWRLTVGRLPPGLSLDPATGVISGTPTASGSFAFTVLVSDSSESTQTDTYSCAIVVAAILSVTSACPLPPGQTGQSFSVALTASGGIAPYTWILQTGSLPPGLTLASTGVISGIPTASGTFPFTALVSDTSGQTYSGQRARFSCSLVISSSLRITSTCPVAPGRILQPYTFALTASGGVSPYKWSLTGGSLPSGFSLDPNTGVISGTTAAAGTFSFTAQVADSAGQRSSFSCSIVISNPPLQISGCPASQAPQGVPYSQFLTVSGGSGRLSWTISVGSLPPGLSLAGNHIFGTPTGPPGTTRFSISAISEDDSTELACSITVTAPVLQITSGCPADGIQGSPYGPFTLTAAGSGTSGFVFSIINGSLPAGLALNGNTISGTPSGPPGASVFGIQVTSGTATATAGPCTLTIAPQPLGISGTCPATAQTGTPVAIPVAVSGGKPPYTFSLTGDSWFSFTGGVVSGTPPSAGSGSFTLTVTDSGNSPAKTFSCRFPVTSAPLSINAVCPANPLTVNTPFSLQLSASGGSGTYIWSLSGPPWLSASAVNGPSITVSGTPPSAGSFPFTVQLADSTGSSPVTFSCTLTVNPAAVPPLVITPGAACPASPLAFQSSFSLAASASGGVAPYSWSLSGPSFLSLSSAAGATTTVAGVANSAGSVPFTLTLRDSAGTQPATFSCTLSVNAAVIPTITVTGLGTPANLFNPISAGLSLASPSPVILTGRVVLTFTPSATNPIDNPQVHFSDPCLRNCTFTVPVGSSTLQLPAIEVGTVAGTIHIEVVDLRDADRDVLPAPHPGGDIVIARAKPVITSITFENETATGFDIVLSGYSTPRDMNSVNVTISARNGTTLDGTTQFTFDVANLFNSFYQSARSTAGGSMFTGLRMTVSVSGNKDEIGSVTVTLTNSAGSSDPASKSR